MTEARKPLSGWIPVALIWVATFAAYAPAYRAAFIWNDEDYVTKPELVPVSGLSRIWFEVGATQQYYPALHTAFWIQHRLWGDSPLGYHLANIAFHALAACLFALALRRLAVPGAWLAGLLFALHPICVESVAWVSEEKNTLSLVFYLLAAWAWVDWDEKRGQGRYALASALFLLAILTKSLNATLPGALLVIAWWRRGRLDWRRDVVPMLPWFVVGAADGLFTGWVEHHYLGAEGPRFALSATQRLLLAGRTAWFYLGKIAWPANLIFIYPRWIVDPANGAQYVFPLALVAALGALAWYSRRSRAPLAAILFFLGSLFPTSGILTVFAFLYSYVADHWAYLPALGPIALAAAAWETRAGGNRLVRLGVPAVVLVLFGVITWRQSRMYAEPVTFYQTILARNPDAWMAHNNLGILFHAQGRNDEALSHYREAVRLAPEDPKGHNNVGNILLSENRTAEAEAEYRQALALDPLDIDALLNLGNLLRDSNRLDEALADYGHLLQLDPDSPEVHNNLGIAYGKLNRAEEAIAQFREAIRLRPNYAQAHYDLAVEFHYLNRGPDALAEYETAVRADPGFFDAQLNLGVELLREHRAADAAERFEAAARLSPNSPAPHLGMAYALRALGRTEDAAAQLDEARRLQASGAR